jgi:hypothetical protein
MAYSEQTIATLKKEFERKKKHIVKVEQSLAVEKTEAAELEKDISENDPATAPRAAE